MSIIDDIKLSINYSPFRFFKPFNQDLAESFIDNLKQDAKNTEDTIVCIVGDWDVDGGLAAKIFHNFLTDINIRHDIYFGKEKMHGITQDFINEVVNKKYKYIIIVDSSSESLSELTYLNNLGVNVLVIDHHVCNYNYEDYPERVILINAKMKGNDPIKEISAGMLVYLVTSFLRGHCDILVKPEDLMFGYITLISDSCKLDNGYIKSIILSIGDLKEIPPEIRLFMNKYTIINKDFFIFKFNNILNNMFRLERIDLIYKLLYNDIPLVEKMEVVSEMQDLHDFCSSEMLNLAEKANEHIEDLGSCVLCNLSDLAEYTQLPHNYLINATGLLANKLSASLGTAALVYMDYTATTFKFSGRDIRSLFPLQNMIKVLDLNGGGHIGAAGFEIPKPDLDNIRRFARKINQDKDHVLKSRVLSINKISEQSLELIFLKVAMYNEICSGDMVPIRLKITLDRGKFLTKDIGKLRIFSLGKITIKDLLQQSYLDDTVEIKPIFNDFLTAKICYI